ncbi:uncharacterized protein LOC131958242 [Physella acuta]|uniref:uncharacterized protein LOC131958242 n=1 Tax=Physella acuta TaxID=109671 RepID=UPI0027DCA399|nr:uncharacterized protein LOC131958242 [Physella acuta]
MVQEKDKSNLIFDETTISNASWRAVADTTSWRFVYLNITPGLHEAYTTEGAPFGCYIYGTGDRIGNVFKEAYAANVGFIVATIYGNVSGVLPEMTAGDMFDNDRDQRVDEEAPNGIDDDGDGLIDEDLAFPKTNHGNWGPWSEWLCPGVCGMARRHKVRTCSNPPASGYGLPCKGVSTFTGGNDSCHTGHICPEDCGTGTYLVDCVGDCSNCENDCNKFNGSCDRCRLGWMDPLHACNTECPEMTFGFHCTGSCSDKCSNHDCLDRIQGTCPVVGQTRDFMLLLPILLFCPICFLPCIFRRKVQMLPESEVQDLTLPF